ncbi:hypothetical protein J2785_004015 [Burkholderia ambifaria]|nr:hypothetical protein [Burkholderia ambifaria]
MLRNTSRDTWACGHAKRFEIESSGGMRRSAETTMNGPRVLSDQLAVTGATRRLPFE